MTQINDDVVLFETVADHVALVTINRPEARNAVNGAVARALEAAVDRVDGDPDIRVAVLAGSGGRVFCAGADLKEVSRGAYADLSTERNGFGGFVAATRRKPWIAAVEGLALAGGCELALACDLIVASEGGGFGLPEVTRGLIAAAGGLYRLPRALPRAIALELILTAGRISAERAAAFGMVNRLVPAGRVVEEAVALAGSIAVNAPLAVVESLRIAKLAGELDERALAEMSDDAQERLSTSADFAEGPRAFIEKRPPVWTGT